MPLKPQIQLPGKGLISYIDGGKTLNLQGWLLLLVSAPLLAQSSGTITGQVLDQSQRGRAPGEYYSARVADRRRLPHHHERGRILHRTLSVARRIRGQRGVGWIQEKHVCACKARYD